MGQSQQLNPKLVPAAQNNVGAPTWKRGDKRY